MTESTIVVPRGWDDLADAEAFYPDDLPRDWRLTYFANQFGATLLPWTLWASAGATEWSQWAEDVTGGFRFVAELGAASHPTQAHAELQRALGQTLNAWLLADRGLDAQREHDTQPDVPLLPCWQGTAGPPSEFRRGETDAYAAIAPAVLHRDLRGARRWLDDLGRRNGRPPSIVILTRPASATLIAWQQLVELLGLDPA